MSCQSLRPNRFPLGDICSTPSTARSGSGSIRYACATTLKIIDLFGVGFGSVNAQFVLFGAPHGALCEKLIVVPAIDSIWSMHASNVAICASLGLMPATGACAVDTTTTSVGAKPVAASTVTDVQVPAVISACADRSA